MPEAPPVITAVFADLKTGWGAIVAVLRARVVVVVDLGIVEKLGTDLLEMVANRAGFAVCNKMNGALGNILGRVRVIRNWDIGVCRGWRGVAEHS